MMVEQKGQRKHNTSNPVEIVRFTPATTEKNIKIVYEVVLD
jgi:hypothetical protein